MHLEIPYLVMLLFKNLSPPSLLFFLLWCIYIHYIHKLWSPYILLNSRKRNATSGRVKENKQMGEKNVHTAKANQIRRIMTSKKEKKKSNYHSFQNAQCQEKRASRRWESCISRRDRHSGELNGVTRYLHCYVYITWTQI